MKKRFFFILLYFLSLSSAISQTGIVKFGVEVDNGYFEILINDTLLLKRYKDTLPAGNYTAKVWSPTYETKEIEFNVVEGQSQNLHVKMRKTDAYLEYFSNRLTWDRKKQIQVNNPIIITSLFAVSTITFQRFIVHFNNKMVDMYSEYGAQKEVFKLKNYKRNFTALETNYNRFRSYFYGSLALTSVSAVTGFFTIRNFRKKYKGKRPYYKDASPWQNRVSFNGGFNNFSLIYRL